MELSEARPGDVVNFTYKQPMSGPSRRFLARVVEVRNLTTDEISRMDSASDYRKYDREFLRTPTLVTCNIPGGHTRNFYAERSERCVRPPMGQVSYTIQDLIARSMGW